MLTEVTVGETEETGVSLGVTGTVLETAAGLLQDAKTKRALVAKIKRDVFFINDINLR
jgi:hypothetical protein